MAQRRRWGMYGDKPPCTHLLQLRDAIRKLGIEIWSERGEDPQGWVNVWCGECHRTYQTTLRPPWEAPPE